MAWCRLGAWIAARGAYLLRGEIERFEQTKAAFDDRMLQPVCGEFLEMPGLRVTCAQAQSLWGLNEPTCRALLEFLVEAKFLRCTSGSMYARTSDGIAELPSLQQASADASPHR